MNLRKTGILLAWATIIAANGTAQNVQRPSQGIKYAAQGMDVSIEFYSPTIVRVYKTLSETASDKDAGVPSYNVRQAFLLDKDEVIYGLG